MRNLAGLLALAILAVASTETQAAFCTVEHVGQRYHAQVRVSHPSRVWVYSAGGAPMLRYTAPSTVEVLPPTIGSTATGFNACDNVVEVFDALADAEANYNQCVGAVRQGTFAGQSRVIECDAEAP